MSKKYKNLGGEPDKIFARANQAGQSALAEEKERRDAELEEIETLAKHAVFKSWLRRTFRQNGGMFNDFLKTDAGQAQGMTLYYIARDLARTDAGLKLIEEIVGDQFGKAISRSRKS